MTDGRLKLGVLTEFKLKFNDDSLASIERHLLVCVSELFLSEFRQLFCWYEKHAEETQQRIQATTVICSIVQLLHTTNVSTAFPNAKVFLRVYLLLMANNCSCSRKRSFSQLSRTKDVKQSPTSQHRSGAFALLCVERDLLAQNWHQFYD